MPIKKEREYRMMPIMAPAAEKRIDSEHYVEGHATTFGEPYVLLEYDGCLLYTSQKSRQQNKGKKTVRNSFESYEKSAAKRT